MIGFENDSDICAIEKSEWFFTYQKFFPKNKFTFGDFEKQRVTKSYYKPVHLRYFLTFDDEKKVDNEILDHVDEVIKQQINEKHSNTINNFFDELVQKNINEITNINNKEISEFHEKTEDIINKYVKESNEYISERYETNNFTSSNTEYHKTNQIVNNITKNILAVENSLREEIKDINKKTQSIEDFLNS